ncbi:nucleotidyltransferase domain-containing protein [Candidatus Woesearchaeota archaeon]|nr:nucleotidyltransferase domain-containing protein [Candidatus Woesearchaeota archaeon]
MTEYLPHAQGYASDIARIIVDHSYKGSLNSFDYDVLLFGSVVRGEKAHDIDMLIIHNNRDLNEYGMATTYAGSRKGMIPDPNPSVAIEEGQFSPQELLKALSSK